jgi:hypothetical protein
VPVGGKPADARDLLWKKIAPPAASESWVWRAAAFGDHTPTDPQPVNEGTWSIWMNFKTKAPPPPPPLGVPTPLAYNTSAGFWLVQFGFTPVPGATDYQLMLLDQPDGPYTAAVWTALIEGPAEPANGDPNGPVYLSDNNTGGAMCAFIATSSSNKVCPRDLWFRVRALGPNNQTSAWSSSAGHIHYVIQ